MIKFGSGIVKDGLVLYLDAGNPRSYSLSGTTVYDISKNNNSGTLTNDVGYNSDYYGNFSFDGVNDYIVCNSFNVEYFTISVWLYKTSSELNQGICEKDLSWGLYQYNGTLHVSIGIDWSLINTNYTIPINQWVNIVYCYSGTGTSDSQKVYVNGSSVWSSSVGSGSLSPNSNLIKIGYSENEWYLGGKISQTSIYNKVLSQEEIEQNFNVIKFRFGSNLNLYALDIPAGLTVTALSSSSIKIDWTNGASPQDGISIERSADGVSGWSEVATVTSGATHNDTGLTSNHYYYRLRSYRGATYSDYTSVVSNATPLVVLSSNTVARYEVGDGSATYLTKDGSNYVSEWKDLSGNSRHLVQGNGSKQPILNSDSIVFDGIDNVLYSSVFSYGQPIQLYLVLKQISWTGVDTIVNGSSSGTASIQQWTSSPNLIFYAGTPGLPLNPNLPIGEFGIIRALFHSTNSKSIINNTSPVSANFGTAGLNQIVLAGSYLALNAYFANISIKEAIFRNVADSEGNETDIYNYLKTKYSL